jgi:hypothetical protein
MGISFVIFFLAGLVSLILYIWILLMIHSIRESLNELVKQGRQRTQESTRTAEQHLEPADLENFLSVLSSQGVRLELSPNGKAIKFSGNPMRREHVDTYRRLERQIISRLQHVQVR